MDDIYRVARFLLVALSSLLSISSPQRSYTSTPPAAQSKDKAYMLDLLWWPEYCRGNPRLKYCAGASFRGFVLGAFIPLSDNGRIHTCETQAELFGPDNKLLKLMPDETLLRTQWKLYGACSGLSQTRYFDHLSQIYRSIRIPKAFISPTDHFEVSIDQIKKDFVQINPTLSRDSLSVFCQSGFLSKVQVRKDSHMAKPTGACEYQRVQVIAKMPLAE
jgi:ribonuclease T2